MALETTFAFRCADEELAEIQRIADREDRTRSYVVRELVSEALAARRQKEQNHETA